MGVDLWRGCVVWMYAVDVRGVWCGVIYVGGCDVWMCGEDVFSRYVMRTYDKGV